MHHDSKFLKEFEALADAAMLSKDEHCHYIVCYCKDEAEELNSSNHLKSMKTTIGMPVTSGLDPCGTCNADKDGGLNGVQRCGFKLVRWRMSCYLGQWTQGQIPSRVSRMGEG
jgi:hypothetical protein